MYSPQAIPESAPCCEELPDELHTSLFLQSTNSDYKVVICTPCIEYNVSTRSTSLVKQLTREETCAFIRKEFEEWTDQSIALI